METEVYIQRSILFCAICDDWMFIISLISIGSEAKECQYNYIAKPSNVVYIKMSLWNQFQFLQL